MSLIAKEALEIVCLCLRLECNNSVPLNPQCLPGCARVVSTEQMEKSVMQVHLVPNGFSDPWGRVLLYTNWLHWCMNIKNFTEQCIKNTNFIIWAIKHMNNRPRNHGEVFLKARLGEVLEGVADYQRWWRFDNFTVKIKKDRKMVGSRRVKNLGNGNRSGKKEIQDGVRSFRVVNWESDWLCKRVRGYKVMEEFRVRFVQVCHINVKATTSNNILHRSHCRFNARTKIVDRLGRRVWRTVEAAKGKRWREVIRLDRNPQRLHTRSRSTTRKDRTRQMINTVHSNTTTTTISIAAMNRVTRQMDLTV